MLLYGAGDGNRTHATSLEGWDSTIELHPRAHQCLSIITMLARIVNRFRITLQNFFQSFLFFVSLARPVRITITEYHIISFYATISAHILQKNFSDFYTTKNPNPDRYAMTNK